MFKYSSKVINRESLKVFDGMQKINNIKKWYGTYKDYKSDKYQLPSGRSKEIDHINPDSITQGHYEDKYAIPLHKDQHRRKDTTGSSRWSKDTRDYLKHAREGHVPFAGLMGTTSDHKAAAVAIDLSNTFTERTLKGIYAPIPGSKEPRIPPKSREVTLGVDARASLNEAEKMVGKMRSDGEINDNGRAMLRSRLSELHEHVKGMKLP